MTGRTLPPDAPGAPPAARVLLADDHELTREALLSVLSGVPDLWVVGQARDGAEAIAEAKRLRPDLVVMDIRMPGVDGLEATRAITAALPATKVVVLTSHESRHFVLEALRAGAAGYLPKGASKQEVLATMRDVLRGARRVQPDLAAALLGEEAVAPEASRLSERELDVLRLLAGGLSNDEIGRELHLTLNTVKTHVTHVLRKLGVPDRAAAVARAGALGLLDAG